MVATQKWTECSDFWNKSLIQPARGGLFTDLTIYLYGGTSADLREAAPQEKAQK